MTSKTFVSGTVIDSAWLNDVNDSIYAADTAPVGSFRASLESSTGASFVGYTPLGTGVAPTDLQSKLREEVSFLDFYANGVSGAKVDPTGVVDSTLGIQAAIDYAAVKGYPLARVPGLFKVSKQGANNYCLTFAKASPNPAWAQAFLTGAGNSGTPDDITSLLNYGTTFYVDAPAAGVPILEMYQTRGLYISGINFVGNGGKAIAGTVAVRSLNQNIDIDFNHCSFTGFESACHIVGSQNNDTLSFTQCYFGNLVYAILNEGIESYQVRMTRNFFFTSCDWVYKTVADGSGVVMAGLKLRDNMIMVKEGLVWINAPGLNINVRDVLVMDGNTVETANTNTAVFLKYDGLTNIANPFGFVMTNNTLNMGDTASLYDSVFRFINYVGLGPFRFENNRVDCARVVFEINTFASSQAIGASVLANNKFSNRPIIRYNSGSDYPHLWEYGNDWSLECAQSVAAPSVGVAFAGAPWAKMDGRITASNLSATLSSTTLLAGSRWSLPSPNSEERTEIYCRTPGTYGTLSGVTATLVNGASTASIVTSGSDRLKIYGGCFIQIGASGILQVADIIGSTIYLQSAYGGATQTAQAVDYFPFNIKSTCDYTSTAPTIGTWAGGDVAWNINATAGGVPGWVCTTGGTPGTWKAMAALAA